jgi:chemotaxis protein methyltransferase CheR
MLRPDEFEFLAKLLKERSGLVVTADKGYLLESRLTPVARARSLSGLSEIVTKLKTNDESLARDVTEAMTTNESFFFRDDKPFTQFKEMVLPHVMAARAAKKSIRIWSAACSSGQEA